MSNCFLLSVTRLDPTHTTLLRRRFVCEAENRLQQLSLNLGYLLVNERATTNYLNWFITNNHWLLAHVLRGYKHGLTHGYNQYHCDKNSGITKNKRRDNKEQINNEEHIKELEIAKLISNEQGSKHGFLQGVFNKHRVDWLHQLAANELVNITDRMRRQIAKLAREPLSPTAKIRRIEELIPSISRAQAATLARTETSRAHAEGQLDALEAMGLEDVGVSVEWSTSGLRITKKGFPSPCKLCAPLRGIVLKINEARGLIPRHPNCVVGETVVQAIDPLFVMASKYTGVIIDLLTADNRILSVTANHIVLTQRGWAFAKDITDRDYLINCPAADGYSIAPNEYKTHAPIRDVFDSFVEVSNEWSMAKSLPMPHYFHGDGKFIDSEIDIISTDSILWNEDNSSLATQFVKSSFYQTGTVDSSGLLCNGPLSSFLEGAASTTDSLVRSSGVSDVLLARLFTVSESNRLSHATSLGFRNYKDFGNSAPTEIEFNSQGLSAGSAKIQFNDLIRGKLVKVKSCSARHVIKLPVYDVNTQSTLYAANGLLTSNCLCSFIPAGVGERGSTQKTQRSRIMGAIQKSLSRDPNTRWPGASIKLDRKRLRSIIENYDPLQQVILSCE